MYDDVIGVGPVAGDVGGGDEAAESAALVGEVSEVGEAEGGREGLGAVALFAFGDEDGECGCAAPFLAAFAQSVEFDVGGRRARCTTKPKLATFITASTQTAMVAKVDICSQFTLNSSLATTSSGN